MTTEEYFALPEVANSDLTWLKNQSNTDAMHDPYDSFRMGTLVDILITEPESFNFIGKTIGKYLYSEEEITLGNLMRKSFFMDKFCLSLYKMSKSQVIMTGDVHLEYGGVKYSLAMKCKYDLFSDNAKIGSDIKSTVATTQEQFESSIYHFDYDRQRAVYMNVSGVEKDVVIGISKKNFNVFKVFIKKGDKVYTSGMEKLSSLGYKYYIMFG
jgi:hypothetical protein